VPVIDSLVARREVLESYIVSDEHALCTGLRVYYGPLAQLTNAALRIQRVLANRALVLSLGGEKTGAHLFTDLVLETYQGGHHETRVDVGEAFTATGPLFLF